MTDTITRPTEETPDAGFNPVREPHASRGRAAGDGDVLDDLFHGCALAAFLAQAHAQQSWPDPEATRRLACRFYEDALAARTAGRHPGGQGPGESDGHSLGEAEDQLGANGPSDSQR